MLVFWSLFSLVRNSVVLAVYLLFLVSASLPYISICTRIIIPITLKQVDDTPHRKASAKGNYQCL
jgi:hypothetical protein